MALSTSREKQGLITKKTKKKKQGVGSGIGRKNKILLLGNYPSYQMVTPVQDLDLCSNKSTKLPHRQEGGKKNKKKKTALANSFG